MAKRKPTKDDIEQRRLVSVGENGPTPERAVKAGDPLLVHRATGEYRRKPGGLMEPVDSGAIRVAEDTLERLYKRGRLAPDNLGSNLAMREAGRRLESLIYRAGMTGSIPSPNLAGSGGSAPGSSPYVRSMSILDARNELAEIRLGMVRRDWDAVEMVVVTGFTVEQGGQMLGGSKQADAVFMDRLRGGLEWLVGHWGMMTGRRVEIRAVRAMGAA